MTTGFDKTNKGTLRKNDKKQEDWHPDYRGQVNVEGADFWIDATLKQWEDGTRYMALKVRRKEPRSDAALAPAPAARAPAREAPRQTRVQLDDEVPF